MAIGSEKRRLDGEDEIESRGERDDEEGEAAERWRESARWEFASAANARGWYSARSYSERFRAQVAKESEKAWFEGGVVGEGGGREISRRRRFEVDESEWKDKRGKVRVGEVVEVRPDRR
jgi:hypothetical protein